MCPCITVSRGEGHWVTSRGRHTKKQEMMRLQGMDPTKFTVAVTQAQLGKQLGNTMSVNVLERLFVCLLPAANLVKKNEVKDRWENGSALKDLIKTIGKGLRLQAPHLVTRSAVHDPEHRHNLPSVWRWWQSLRESSEVAT